MEFTKASAIKSHTKLPTLKPLCKAKEGRTGLSALPGNSQLLEKPKTRILISINGNKGVPRTRCLSPTAGCSRADIPSIRSAALRRRSKSVSDLRYTGKQLKTENIRGLEKVPSHKATKRPQNFKNENDGASQPKIPKQRKIPDWDYKSRFLDLQQKHTNVVEELKKLKRTVSNLPELEANLKVATHKNTELQNENLILTEERSALQRENSKLLIDNSRIEQERLQMETNYNELKQTYLALKDKHNEAVEKVNNYVLQSKDFMETLEKTQYELKQSNERLLSYQGLLDQNERQRRVLHNTVQDLKGNIRVFCRVRPPISIEEQNKLQCPILFPDEVTLEIRKTTESVSYLSRRGDLKQEFNFDRVFPPDATQVEVFEELAQLVQSALDGYHVCVFAYGQTGAGKTYTMEGTPENIGMIPRTIDLVFEKINSLKNLGWCYEVSASFLEIYNENIRDLLEPNSTLNYEPKFNDGRGITVTNLKIVDIDSAKDLKSLVEKSQKNRATASTDFNLHSSRSHSITKINLNGKNLKTNVIYSGSIHLVDLAGSESAKTTTDQRLTETKNINKSLTELGKVMLALHNKDGHIPYRNSKLTFLLQSCLRGNSKTLMIVNIAPFEDNFSETVNSLRFASKVKEVKIKVKKNKTYSSANN